MKDTSLYEKNKNPDQESLVLNNLNLVKRIALHLKARLPSHVELDELMQVGMIGLIEASKSFNFDKGIQFENYAHARVRGSMIDEIRKMSSQPRSSLTLKKNISEATIQLQGKLGRKPNEQELAEHIGISVSELQKDISLSRKFETTSIETLENEILNIPANESSQPELILENSEIIRNLELAIDKLPERDKLIMSLYYVDEMNLKEIGEILNVSESRISQIMSSTVKNLKATMNKQQS